MCCPVGDKRGEREPVKKRILLCCDRTVLGSLAAVCVDVKDFTAALDSLVKVLDLPPHCLLTSRSWASFQGRSVCYDALCHALYLKSKLKIFFLPPRCIPPAARPVAASAPPPASAPQPPPRLCLRHTSNFIRPPPLLRPSSRHGG